MGQLKGRITNIQRYSIHDGPGVRNTVFLKGCPLRCAWCANPETQTAGPQLAYSAVKCIGCGRCQSACPHQALRLEDTGVVIDRARCRSCFTCADSCYAGALHVFGQELTVDQTYRRLQTNRAWRMGGGVTVSGGEPLLQAEFTAALLRRCRNNGIHTAIETSGYAPWEALAQTAEQCDLVYFDVKIADPGEHRRYTGVDNALILENLRRLSAQFPRLTLIVRTPVIPGVNNSSRALGEIAAILSGLPHLSDYELLPYHGFGEPKYAQLGMAYQLAGTASENREEIMQRNNLLRQRLGLSADSTNN